MKNRLMVIVIMLCVGLHPMIGFSAQQPQEQQSYWQRFSNWVRGQANYAYESAPTVEKMAVGTAGVAWLRGMEPGQAVGQAVGGYMTFQGVKQTWHAIQNGTIGGSLAAGALLSAGLFLTGIPIVNEVGHYAEDPWAFQKYALLTFGAIGLGATSAGLISAVYQNVFAPIKSGEVQRDATVDNALLDMTYEMVKVVMSDEEAYPTYSTKIHALLKKNEFLSGDDTDVVVEQACNKLIKELKLKHVKGAQEGAIDEFLGMLRPELQGKNDQQQIEYLMIHGIKTFSPRERAILSLLRRLQNKLLIDLKRQAQGVK